MGLLAAVIAVAARLPLEPLLSGRSPYASVFLGVVAAAVLAGWRSGLLALLVGQALAWLIVVERGWSIDLRDTPTVAAFGFTTLTQLVILTIITLYQREVRDAMADQHRQMDLLSEALREIDHRTRNNYQTVVALILLQAQRAEAPEVRKALAEAADRVRAVSLASDRLALTSEDIGTVRLGDHLRELCEQLKRGLTGSDVLLRCDFADMTTRADTAIHLSIIVNELVTNALKHAFDGSRGEIRVSCAPAGRGLELVIADNGGGMKRRNSAREGLGTKLVERFIRELNAKHEVQSADGAGTTHRILVENVA